MIDVFTKVVFAGACLFTFAWVILAQRRTIKRLSDAYLRLTHFQRVLVALAVIVCTVYAQKPSSNDVEGVSGTNEVEIVEGGETNEVGGIVLNAPQPMSNGASFFGGCGALGTVRPTVAVRPCRLESVSTNGGYSYALPADGTIRGTWYLTGAYEDVQKVALDDFRFPLGNDLCDSLWAYTWGKVRPQLKNASNEIAAVGAPMSAIPVVSRFWAAATSNDTYLLTWENFVAGRARSGEDAASPFLSAQIELFRNGDFIARSNDVECLYRRVIEPNPINPINPPDPDDPSMPLYPYGPVQDLSVIGETNAYCWVDIVVNTADAWVRFEGDRVSNLADPSFAAKAGETNHVVILIGKTYKVTCDMPFTVVGKSDPAIDEWWEDGNTLWLNWPVDIWARGDDEESPLLLMSFGSGSHRGNDFTMFVSPSGLGGEFSWTNSCCAVYGSGMHFSYGCDGFCLCGGCSARGYYGYEGYRIGCSGGSCGCSWYDDDDRHGEDDPDDPEPTPSISVCFDDDAVIYEDAYTNAPGNVEPWRSTTTKLHLEVHGGVKGGTAEFIFTNQEKLLGPDIPESINVPAGHCKKYEFTYRGQLPSGSTNDIVVTGTFTENDPEGEGDAATYADEASTTSVKVELTAEYDAPENHNPSRHMYGVGEKVRFKIYPQEPIAKFEVVKADSGDNVTVYDTFAGDLSVENAQERVYTCPAAGTTPDITVSCLGVDYSPAMSVIEPQLIQTPSARFDGTFIPGQVGMGTLITVNYIGPMTVSFKGVKVFEVPCVNAVSPVGYFATSNYTGRLSHDYYAGAGPLHSIQDSNYWTTDYAGRELPYENWSAGRLEWKIPIGWRRFRSEGDDSDSAFVPDYAKHLDFNSRPLIIGNDEGRYMQIWTIEADGSSSIEKFGYRLSRSRWSLFGSVSEVED